MIQKKQENEKGKVKRQATTLGLLLSYVLLMTLFCKLTGYSLIIPLLLFFLGWHLAFSDKGQIKLFLQLGLLITLIIFITHGAVNYFNVSPYYIPVAGIAMLTMLLFNSRQLSFIMAFICSLIVTLILNGDFGMMITFFLGALAGAYAVREARTRGQLITAGFSVVLIHVVAQVLFYPEVNMFTDKAFLNSNIYPLLFNGINSAFLVVATLKVFEYLFGVLTNFSLLELADFNQPLLKRLILEAPGTYHHSLVVSNLSEAAADAIGAHSLLTRVGAYYHDIGKMVKPEYFTENQIGISSKHDNIEPSMSRLVILNHVKEGIDMAKKYRLNQAIVDFIPQHHGTGLIYYFYQKSLEGAEREEEIDEENFRYPGPKPQTRETAITLLADSVEGATRALDDPNPKNIEETVKKVINNKFIDGQLDECNLTLKEIDKISSTFTRVLSSMYHGRVKYPEKKNGNSHNKSTKKASPKAGSDQEEHDQNSQE